MAVTPHDHIHGKKRNQRNETKGKQIKRPFPGNALVHPLKFVFKFFLHPAGKKITGNNTGQQCAYGTCKGDHHRAGNGAEKSTTGKTKNQCPG